MESNDEEQPIMNLDNSLICIEYPGQVKNIQNVLKTLGGISKVSEVSFFRG